MINSFHPNWAHICFENKLILAKLDSQMYDTFRVIFKQCDNTTIEGLRETWEKGFSAVIIIWYSCLVSTTIIVFSESYWKHRNFLG